MIDFPLLDPRAFTYVANALLLLFVVTHPLLSLIALWQLRRRSVQGIALALWVIIVLFVPILGATASFITMPQQRPQDTRPA